MHQDLYYINFNTIEKKGVNLPYKNSLIFNLLYYTTFKISHVESDEQDNIYILEPTKNQDEFEKVFKKDVLVIKDFNNLIKCDEVVNEA